MEAYERELVVQQLASSEARLLVLLDGLSAEQWHFREAPERWSIAENIEHLVAFEQFILAKVEEALQGAPEPEKKAASGAKEPLALGLAETRRTKLNAREALKPTGRWPDTVEMLAEFRRARARTVAFAAETQAELRDHFFPHIAFGDLDCCQWLLVIGQHGMRHALQIEEIKADARYPAA